MGWGGGGAGGFFPAPPPPHDLQPTSEYQMTVGGNGVPGFVKGEGKVQITGTDTGALLQYSGDVSAGGPIASLGQRMIGGAARMVIDQFFRCAARKLKTGV